MRLRAETYDIGLQAIENLDEELANELRDRAAGKGQVRSTRRLLRTGNYELTNTHFHWISKFEEIPDSETEPVWAVLLERVSWGRFYGVPAGFVIEHVRDESEIERQLREIVQFFQANRFRLSGQQQQKIDLALPTLQQQLVEQRGKHLTSFIESLPHHDECSVETVIDNGQVLPLDEVKRAKHNVVSVRARWKGAANTWSQLQKHHESIRQQDRHRVKLEKHDLGHANQKLEDARLSVRQVEIDHDFVILPWAHDLKELTNEILALGAAKAAAVDMANQIKRRSRNEVPITHVGKEIVQEISTEIERQMITPTEAINEIWADIDRLPPAARKSIEEFLSATQQAYKKAATIQKRIDEIKDDNARYQLSMETASGKSKLITIADIVRAIPANQLSTVQRLGIYFSRWYEFLVAEPREANSEGGVMAAIWGTVAMTLIMSLMVVPFGVLAALYLREYAKAGPIVSAVRISINNQAGVPSIVFGVFGLGFFCYIIGGFVDGDAKFQVPPARWWFLLAILSIIAIVAFTLSLRSLTHVGHSASRKASILAHFTAILLVVRHCGTGVLVGHDTLFHRVLSCISA